MSRLKTLTAEYRELKARLEQGGGPDKVRRQHEQGKLTARERIDALLDQELVNLFIDAKVYARGGILRT